MGFHGHRHGKQLTKYYQKYQSGLEKKNLHSYELNQKLDTHNINKTVGITQCNIHKNMYELITHEN